MTTEVKPDRRAPKVPKRRGGGYFHRVNLLTSLVLIFPLFVVYQIGVLAMPQVHNGADLVTSELLQLLHGNLAGYQALAQSIDLALFK